jgi:hypothetical protein
VKPLRGENRQKSAVFRPIFSLWQCLKATKRGLNAQTRVCQDSPDPKLSFGYKQILRNQREGDLNSVLVKLVKVKFGEAHFYLIKIIFKQFSEPLEIN